MSNQYTRDRRHDFLTTLRKTEQMLSALSAMLSNQTYKAVDDMDLITEEDAAEMRSRLGATETLFDSWDDEAFSWRKP